MCSYGGRFVKADDTIKTNGYGLVDEPNATCASCGRTQMVFEGYL